jgi:branched-chain amino acid transport system substrate-binding protein
MLADRTRLASLLAVTLLALAAAGCSRGENTFRVGLLTDCRGIYSGYEEQMLAGAELPLLRHGARLTNGKPSGGVSGARVAGRAVELVRGCTEESENSILVEEARRLVEDEGVDAVVGPFGEEDSLIAREVARKYPDVVFIPAWSGAQELTLRHPAANVYRFDTDEAQDVAGLGTYAYRTLGWRSAVTVEDGTFVGWQEEAAFVAEFCALGGKMKARLYLGGSISKLSDPRKPKVARTIKEADGVALLTWGLLTPSWLVPTLSRTLGSLPNRLILGAYLMDDSNSFVHVALPAGVVGVSSTPPANSTPAMRRHRAEFSKAFPGLFPADAETRAVLAFHDAMEGLLRGIEAADGDLSDGRQRLHESLAEVRFDAPSSPVRLDRNRQAVRNTYVERVGREPRKRELVRVVPGVEQTFRGLLSSSPAPGPGSQPCRKGSPPSWAR